MLASAILNSNRVGRLSSVFIDAQLENSSISDIQRVLDESWSKGADAKGRAHYAGKVTGKKRWIGVVEIQLFFCSLGVRFWIADFIVDQPKRAIKQSALIIFLRKYFRVSPKAAVKDGPSVDTQLKMPVMLQRHGHSVTIVGIEDDDNGATSLIILDPSVYSRHIKSSNKNVIVKADAFLRKTRYQLGFMYEVDGDRCVLPAAEDKYQSRRIVYKNNILVKDYVIRL